MSLLESALQYAQSGNPVFPVHAINALGNCTCKNPSCPHPGNHTVFEAGFKMASFDPTQITLWWARYPEANIGVAAGEASEGYVANADGKIQDSVNQGSFGGQCKRNYCWHEEPALNGSRAFDPLQPLPAVIAESAKTLTDQTSVYESRHDDYIFQLAIFVLITEKMTNQSAQGY